MPSSRTRPASSAGSSRSSTSSSLTSAAAASVAQVEEPPDHSRPAQHGPALLGQPLEPAGQHVGDGGRRVGLGHQPGQVAAVVGEAGVLDQEERVAVGARGQQPGLLLVRHHLGDRLHHRGRLGGGSPVSSSRAACRRASDSAASASAPVGSGWVRQVPSTSSRPDSTVSISSRSTRRVGHVGPVQVVEHDHDGLVVRRSRGDRSRRSPPRCGTRHPRPPRRRRRGRRRARGAPAATATAAARRRPASTGPPAAGRRGARRGPPAHRTAGTCRCPARR